MRDDKLKMKKKVLRGKEKEKEKIEKVRKERRVNQTKL